MKKQAFILTILLYTVCYMQGWAQGRFRMGSVYVKVLAPNKEENSEEVPWLPVSNCEIYAFSTKDAAKKYYNMLIDRYSLDSKSSGLSMDDGQGNEPDEKFKTGQDGACNMSPVGLTWFLVAFKESETLVSKVIPIADRDVIEIETEAKDNKILKQVKVDGKYKFQEIEVDATPCGNRLPINAKYVIPSKDTYSTFRYGIVPFGREVLGDDYGFTSAYQKLTPTTGKLYKQMRPYLMDGESYHKTQHRKMGYNPEENDPMERYVSAKKVKTRDTTTVAISIHEEILDIKPNAFYPVWGYKWYENYGSVVQSDTILIFNGYRKDPMRFLDYSFPDVTIHKDHYRRDPRPDLDEGSQELHIEFVGGKADILPTDSGGLQQLREITKILEGIYDDTNARLYHVHIHGYASPEGGRSINENLCRQRAGYIQRHVVARLGNTSSDIEGSVASWKDVADLLRADSVADPENIKRAAQIDEIIASSRDEHQIDAKMQSSPLYKFLKENEEKFYKPLRKVEISYTYKQQRILNREEVIEKYEKTKEVTFPYQYAYLFDYLIDRPEELGEVAQKAMKVEKEPTGKPWTLAAYYLAKSYTDRNICDTLILKPYITLNGKEFVEAKPGSYIYKTNPATLLNARHVYDGDTIQYVNDEGIVIQQIHMLIKADRISEALTIARYLLPDGNPKYDTPKKMLRSKCGEFNDDEIRTLVEETSAWNKVVVNAAQTEQGSLDVRVFWLKAWKTLNDTTVFKMEAARELYMKAILAYRLYDSARNWSKRQDKAPVPASFFDIGEYSVFSHPSSFNDSAYPWGAFMVKACEIDPSFLDILKFDGEFNQNYRDGFALYWNDKHPDHILK